MAGKWLIWLSILSVYKIYAFKIILNMNRFNELQYFGIGI